MADKSEIQLASEALEAKMLDFKTTTVKEAKAEAQALEVRLAKAEADLATQVADAAAKGATIIQLQDVQKEWKKEKGRTKFTTSGGESIKALSDVVAEQIGKQEKSLVEYADGKGTLFNVNLKADILSSAMTTTNAYPYASYLDWRPGMEPTGQIRFRDFVRTIPSAYDNVLYPRANKPVGGGSFSKQTTEGVAKSQVDRGYTMIPLQLYPFAGFANVSRQALRNIPFLQGWLPTSMNEQLMDQEDVDFGTTLSGAATGNTSTTGIGTDTNVIAKIVMLIKNMKQAKYNATAIAIDPNLWAQMIITRATTSGDYSLPNVVTVDAQGNTRILGVTVYPVNWIAGNRVIVGDWTKAAIVESEGLTFRSTDSHASLFVANELTFLLERVEGLAIFRPDAFISAGL